MNITLFDHIVATYHEPPREGLPRLENNVLLPRALQHAEPAQRTA